ncbi:MAG: DUF2235 domain-containing protein [Boseongicola sp.]|nr:DUF2235 domain-containing protein [Boseongicola sp.]
MSLGERLKGLLGFFRRTERSSPQIAREAATHVILLDGTMSVLDEGSETNVGLIYKLLEDELGERPVSLFYEAGVQWTDWSATLNVIEGRGINRQIRRAYGWLASRYRPGDTIFLVGYSRGAYAVRSLAGVIDRVGLLEHVHATERMVTEAYRHYQQNDAPEVMAEFRRAYCHAEAPIEAVAVFDTVKSLGFRAPFVWRWAEVKHAFHNHRLGRSIRHGFHALALDETREAFKPVLWETREEWNGKIQQVWFRGSHSDVGGHLTGFTAARPLSNIPLVWMIERLEGCALPLPDGWRGRFEMNADAPSVGTWRNWGKIFLARKKRVVGQDPSERLHPSATGRSPRADEFEDSAVLDV